MRIDKRLHLVVPIYEDDEENSQPIAYVHSTPLGEAVVDRYFMTLGQTYAAIFSQGLGLTSGPANALRVLRFIATEKGIWNDYRKAGNGTDEMEIGIEKGLVAEMRRLSMVAFLKDGKWSDIPLDIAVQHKAISSEDKAEVENAIVFFTVAYATLNRAQRGGMVKAAAELWGAQITSSNFTEWTHSLKTSTETVSSGAKSPAPVKKDRATANATVDGKPSSIPS